MKNLTKHFSCVLCGVLLMLAAFAFLGGSVTQVKGAEDIRFEVSSKDSEVVVYPNPYTITAYNGAEKVAPENVRWYIQNVDEEVIFEKTANPLERPFSTAFEGNWFCEINGEVFEIDDHQRFPEDGMIVVFNNTPILAGKPYTIPTECGSGSVSLSPDGHTLTLDHVQFNADAFTPDGLMDFVLYVESDKEKDTFNIEVIGDCSIAYKDTKKESVEKDQASILLAFARGCSVNINGTSNAVLKGNNITLTQYDITAEDEEDKPNTFNFENIDLYGRSNEDTALEIKSDYINFNNSNLDCYAPKSTEVVALNDTNYDTRQAPSAVAFENCVLNIENALSEKPEIQTYGTLYISAFFSSHDRVTLNNCNTNIVVDKMLAGETRAMTLFDAELIVNGGKLSAAVHKEPDFVDEGAIAAAIQAPVFKALNGADVDLICETDINQGGIATGLTYAKKILIQDAKLQIEATGCNAHGLYFFYTDNETPETGAAVQWLYKDIENTDEGQIERGVDIINSTVEILTKGASTEDYLVNAISGRRIGFDNSLIKLKSISTDGGLAVPVLAYDHSSQSCIFLSREIPVIPKKIKIAKKFYEEVGLNAYYFTDREGNTVTEIVLSPGDESKKSPDTGIDDVSSLGLPLFLGISALMAGLVFYNRKKAK